MKELPSQDRGHVRIAALVFAKERSDELIHKRVAKDRRLKSEEGLSSLKQEALQYKNR